jgi:large subunit ribosomal protein L25
MAVIPIKGNRREKLGKGGARKARAAGEIPVAVSVGAREFDVALRGHKGGNAIVNLSVSGSDFTALVRDVQYDPVTHQILHLDFQHISLTESIEVGVPIHLTGIAVGVKDGGGILEPITRELEVRCLPTAIPQSIDVDVSALNIGDSIHVRDLQLGDLQVLTDPDTTIATVVPPSVMEEKPAEEAAAATAAEPEVIAKGKKEEGEDDEKKKEK